VKYHELPAMLLNELQKLYREVRGLRAQRDEINELKARLEQLESRDR
jgi:prefoldin subunit 5